jgi:hypothetical protein
MGIRLDATGEGLKFSSTQTPITIGGWAKMSVDTGTYQTLWSWESGDPGSDTSAQVMLSTGNGDRVLGVFDGASMNAGPTLTVGTPFRWAVSIGGSPFPMIGYLTNSPTSAVTVVNVGNISPTGLNRFLWGANSYNAEFFNGVFDDLWMVDSVLTQAQIENMWRQRRKNVVTYGRYPLCYSTKADNLVDMSGNGRTLTELGTLAVEDGSPVWAGANRKNKTSVSVAGSGAMAALLTGTGALSGTLTGTGALSAAMTGTGALVGVLTGTGSMSCAMSATASVVGNLTGNSQISAAMAATSTLTGTLAGTGALSAAMTGTGAVSGTLTGAGALSAALTATGALAGSLTNLGGHDLAFNSGVLEYNETPFPRMIRTAWALPVLSVADRNTFLDDCVAKNYTGIEFGAIWHDSRTTGVPFANRGSHKPFNNKLSGGTWTGTLTYGDIDDDAPDFATPNTTYWNYIKAIVDECESRGLIVMLFPSYVGFPGTDQGWMPEMEANGATKIETFGAYVATLLAGNGNVVWMLGGDQGTGSEPFDAGQVIVEQALYDGVTSVAGNSELWSAEWRRNSVISEQEDFGELMTMDGSYANSDNINNYQRQAYTAFGGHVYTQEMPFDQEGSDGNSVNTDATQPCRRFDYWAWLSGIGGYTSGNGYVWPFNDTGSGDDWDQHLNTQCAQDEGRLNAFIKSTIWWTLIPSGKTGMRNLIPSGQGTLTDQDWIAAAANGDSGTASILLAYCPPGADGTFNVDLRVMSGTCRLRWFDPTDGTYTPEAEDVANTEASFAVSTPGANDEGTYDDWLLVVDLGGEVSAALTATGSLTGTLRGTGALSAALAATGALTGTMVGLGQMSATLTATASLTGTPTGTGAMSAAMIATGALTGRCRDIDAPVGENCYVLERRPRGFVDVYRGDS